MKHLDDEVNAKSYWQSYQYIDIYNTSDDLSMAASTQCKTCDMINALCHEYYSSTDDKRKLEIAESLSLYEINGYKLLKFMESNGKILLSINEINDTTHFVFGRDYTDDDQKQLKVIDANINFSVALSKSRWCSFCGARKPDIIDDSL